MSDPRLPNRWALTQETLDRLLGFLGPDRAAAAREYERVRERLIRLFEWRGTAGAEELADETLDRVARKLTEGLEIESDDPFRYFRGVASKIFHETVRRVQRAHASLELASRDPSSHLAPEPPADEDPAVPGRRMECLRKCLEQLSEQSRRLILDYHGHEPGSRIPVRIGLARRLGIEPPALRLRVHRVRQRLEQCTRECLETLPRERG